MDELALFPFTDDTGWLLQHCKLPLHTGIGSVKRHGNPENSLAEMARRVRQSNGQASAELAEVEFVASFFVPPAGNCLMFLRWPGKSRFSRNFGEGLTVTGDSQDGPFQFTCPQYYVKAVSPIGEAPGWAVASPTNHPATVSYDSPRPVASVIATINNFDFDYGNKDESDGSELGKVLRVVATARTVDFAWRSERTNLRRLVDAGLIGTTSFVDFSFASWADATEEDLTTFAHNISTLCCYVAGQHTGIPILSFFDHDGRIIRRTLRGVIQSKFRNNCALGHLHFDTSLPQLFRQCFDEHCRMQKSDLWNRMPSLYAAIEDPPYLEQKYATLMMAVEMLIRNTLIESGYLSQDEAETKTLPTLISLARGTLRWDLPRHYTERERYRITRNAVDHGGSLPHDAELVRADFDKWKLFLIRRLFMRLGFDGVVTSPQNGWRSSSRVDEFSEEHNSFRD